MTATQQFIEDAIKGGWKLHGMFDVSEVKDKYNSGTWRFAKCTNPETGKSFSTHIEYGELLLDPLAWQAVGKTRGWKSVIEHNHDSEDSCTSFCLQQIGTLSWRGAWRKFYHHLADGKTIEEALIKFN